MRPIHSCIVQDQSIPRLQTKRLILRPFCLYDAKVYAELCSDPMVLEGTDMPHDLEIEKVREWILGHSNFWKHEQALFMLMTDRVTFQILGAASLFLHMRHKKSEIGYWVVRGHWGKGYATEAASKLIEYAFTSLNLVRFEANHLAKNPSSGKVLTKLGFRKEGLLRKAYLKEETFEDLVYYGLLKEEFKPIQKALASV